MNTIADDISPTQEILALYSVYTTRSDDSARSIAIGQSIGNPFIDQGLYKNKDHAAKVLEIKNLKKNVYNILISFPLSNFNLQRDGISYLLSTLMGGQVDIDIIQSCRLIDIKLPPSQVSIFPKPKYGIKGVREFVNRWDRPISGAIIKPKTGLKTKDFVSLVEKLIEGGVDLIKEDEILGDPSFCPIEQRVPEVFKLIEQSKRKVVYLTCITADPTQLMDKAKQVQDLGGNGIHFNFWSGLGAYRSIREMNLPLFLFFQKSGDQILLDPQHRYSISKKAYLKIISLTGIDFYHAGMWGSYLNMDEHELKEIMHQLQDSDIMPSLSCGFTPSHVQPINEKFGVDYLANVGGAIQSHPDGIKSGALAMRQAIDGNHSEEFRRATKKLGAH